MRNGGRTRTADASVCRPLYLAELRRSGGNHLSFTIFVMSKIKTVKYEKIKNREAAARY